MKNRVAWGLMAVPAVWGGLVGCNGSFWRSALLRREARSPTGLGVVSLVTDNSSFAGADAWIYVTDSKKGNVPLLLGGSYASDGAVKMQQAIWSRDGSILAVQARVGKSLGKRFQGSFATRYVAAYDYRQHLAFVAAEPTIALSERIDKLLARRGGKGAIIFRDPYDASGQPIPTREARHYSRPRRAASPTNPPASPR